jgi:hypothetical protein
VKDAIVLSVCATLASGAFAACASLGFVAATYANNITANPASSAFFFKNTVTIAGTPACNVNHEYAVKTDTAAGRAIQRQVELAAAPGKEIFVAGDGTCSAWGDRETVLYVKVAY